MASTIENKNTETGTLQFNEKTRSCYILTEEGKEIPTTPMFDFFNGFISIHELIERADDYYAEEDMIWFAEKFNAHTLDKLSATDLYAAAKDKFGF